MDCQPRGRGRGGRGNRNEESRDVRLSKLLSYALRHGASKMGLQMNSDGFVFVEELLAHKQFHSFSLEDVERVVATNDKQRFKLCHHPEDGHLQIRANQGHSVQVTDLELRAVALDDPDYPREAVHGSYMKHWPSIRSQGISRMNRTHMHLASGLPGDGRVISGMRQSCDLAVYVDVAKAISDGIPFFWSENGVLLTPGDAAGMLPPCYFSRAQRLKPSRESHSQPAHQVLLNS
ncbi:tRNA 2'-phosphotransferase 1-like isoform X1 [Sinocyclocheilus anshuiensis]|uniref:tRNA 2'-phosphotransferase 1-like isoform X1 n=1 Tax=Sinocyclocheilus anshuiensis TaxID=1608454 RepID=UPI0007BA2D6F|nr:PREDICTED: tRNA 2'-phosphotransferase 1-like isoform X1 [Sinocyclocheilus anshuiensis]XP_016332489.1 PREDICTED: tRNA 2'-phosphotransferase 1-like isoform X1 [Sinocyclocheilus anshuiensis]XP_016332490.1 PREDICTED: tRNA 2'-phosphotransferase 1-like isoform X1 [Sinocyclocheilus anshuiensis]